MQVVERQVNTNSYAYEMYSDSKKVAICYTSDMDDVAYCIRHLNRLDLNALAWNSL